MTTTGRGFGKTKVTYEDMNVLRSNVFKAENYANFLRGRQGMSTVFRQILPPTVTEGPVRTGCGLLPDPTCLTSFEFSAKVDKSRKISEYAEKCDAAMAGELMRGYLDGGTARWGTHEAKELFKFVDSKATETNTKATDVLIQIEQMTLELEESLFAQLGDLAPERSEFIVLVSSTVESELRQRNWTCCALADQTKSPLANYYGVKQVTALPRTVMPAGAEIEVYVPNFMFGLTMCTEEFAQRVIDNNPKYRPGSLWFFGEEDYGFQAFNFLVEGKDEPIEIKAAIKKSVATPPEV